MDWGKKEIKYSLLGICIGSVVSCTPQSKDKAIKADISVKAKKDIDFAGVNYIVDKGTVVLSGLAPTPAAKQRAEKTVKDIAGVKEVNNQIVIGPVILDEDFPLKQQADSVLKSYNKAQAHVDNGQVILTGAVPKDALPKIIRAFEKLPVNMVNNQLITE